MACAVADAACGEQVVVIPAGVPRKPGMTRDDLFNTNGPLPRSPLFSPHFPALSSSPIAVPPVLTSRHTCVCSRYREEPRRRLRPGPASLPR
eukprot:2303263-Rhodomonas_salina.3